MFRSDAHSGTWMCFLVSFTSISSLIHCKSPNAIDVLSTWLSVYLSLISLSVAYRLYRTNSKCKLRTVLYDLLWTDLIYHRCRSFPTKPAHNKTGFKSKLFLSIVFSNLLYFWGPPDVVNFYVVILTMPFLHLYPILLSKVYFWYPGSFTLGEGVVVVQAAFLFIYREVLDIFLEIEDSTSAKGTFVIIGRAGIFALLFFFFTWSWLSGKDHVVWFHVSLVVVFFTFLLPYLWLTLRRNPILWLVSYVLQDRLRIGLIVFWILCLIATVMVVTAQSSKKIKASTSVRKYFHGLISFVYISGILVDENLLYFASMVALAVFLLAEFIRSHQIEPFGQILDYYFKMFLDEKDGGILVLTNLYLLCGCSSSLWFSSVDNPIAKLAGILSVGIGDSVASIVGFRYGRFKWQKSDKSIEGTAASIFAQISAVWLLSLLGVYRGGILGSIPAITFVAIVEALTDQVDNLVLPLLLYSLLVYI